MLQIIELLIQIKLNYILQAMTIYQHMEISKRASNFEVIRASWSVVLILYVYQWHPSLVKIYKLSTKSTAYLHS